MRFASPLVEITLRARANLVVLCIRRITLIAISLIVATRSSLALQDRIVLSIVPFLSLEWGWYCFRCGDPHHRRECTWSGECSFCGQNHKDVVCRKNPNGKVRWEEISSSASSGTVQMLAIPPSTYWSVPPTQQCLMAPLTSPIVLTPQSGGYWLPHAPTPSTPMVPFHYAPNGVTTGTTSSSGISGSHATPPSDGRNHGNVITGNILVIPSLLELLSLFLKLLMGDSNFLS